MNVDFSSIAPIIEGIAQKLGVAAEHLWGVLVRQAINDGIGDVVIAIALGIISYVGYKLMKWAFRKDENGEFEMDVDFTLPFVGIFRGIALFVIATTCICYFASTVKHFINPEYYAFMDIVGRVKGK